MKTWCLVATAALILLPSCAEEPPAASKDMLFLQTEAGLTVAAAGASSAEFQAPGSLPSADWSTVVRARRHKGSTRVIAIDPVTGERVWNNALDGRFQTKIVSSHGDLVALGPVTERYYTQGRRKTEITILDSTGSQRTLELAGNYEPEAFSTDGQNLFVVKYLPARAPTRYQIRTLDISTGKVDGVYTVDAELQEAMRGTARVQASSPDGNRLYTLYTLTSRGEKYAFIHVLSLDEKWAHCIDLPTGFEEAPEAATAMTVSQNGALLYIANADTGAVAEVDTQTLTVLRTNEVNFGLGRPNYMAIGDGHLFLASGRRLSAVALDSLEERRRWFMTQPIRGLQTAADGFRLYVGQRDRIAVIDVNTGERLSAFDPPGIDRINLLGRSVKLPTPERTNLTCAC
jgi:DNA-binding beta-propeller fold protein YncE